MPEALAEAVFEVCGLGLAGRLGRGNGLGARPGFARGQRQQGWSTLANGDLLRAAEAEGFDVLLTTDKNLAFQQSLKDRKIAVVVLGNPQWPAARLHAQSIVAAVNAATPGSYVVVGIPGG